MEPKQLSIIMKIKKNTLIDLNIINLNVELAEMHRDGLSCKRGKFIAIAIEHITILSFCWGFHFFLSSRYIGGGEMSGWIS